MRRIRTGIWQIAAVALVAIGAGVYSGSSWSRTHKVALPGQIRIIVPFGTGGENDITARLFAPYLQKVLGIRVLVVNIKGGSGNNGLTHLAHSRPDGSTLGMFFTPMTSLLPRLGRTGYNPNTLTPIVGISGGEEVILAAAKSKFNSLKDVAAALKAGKDLTIGVAGYGANAYIASALLMRYPKFAKLRPVPYQSGGEVRNAVVGGHISLAAMGSVVAVRSIKSGQLKALAVAATTRVPVLPGVATAAEQGYKGIEVDDQLGIVGPPGMSPALAAELSAAAVKAAHNPAFVRQAHKVGLQLKVENAATYAQDLHNLSKQLGHYAAAVKRVARPSA